jgi:hypothetical protein
MYNYMHRYPSGSLADLSVIGANGLSDLDGGEKGRTGLDNSETIQLAE